MSDNGSTEPKGIPAEGIPPVEVKREFRVWMMPLARGLSHAEIYSLIDGGYDLYGTIPVSRPLTFKERLHPNCPAGAQRIMEPMLVFVGPADAPEIILEGPASAPVD